MTSLHSGATELKKDKIWDKNTILQPIEKRLNHFINKKTASNYILRRHTSTFLY